MLTLNQVIEYAKVHDISFDKPLMSAYDAEMSELSHIEQVAASAQGTNLVLIDRNAAYSCNLIETLKLQDTVNSVDIHEDKKTPKWINYWNALTNDGEAANSSKLNAFYWYARCRKNKKWAKKFIEICSTTFGTDFVCDKFNDYVKSRVCM